MTTAGHGAGKLPRLERTGLCGAGPMHQRETQAASRLKSMAGSCSAGRQRTATPHRNLEQVDERYDAKGGGRGELWKRA